MSSLAARTEVRKLARTLGCEPERLEALAAAEPSELRALREQLSDDLLEQGRQGFERVVALADRLPASVSASLAPRVLGPPLAGRTAALLSPGKAVDLAGRLPASFLAEIALVVDARHIEHLIGDLSPETIGEVAAELQRREEWLVMGGLVSKVSPASLQAAVAVLSDEGLLRTGPLMEDPSRLAEVLDDLSEERIVAVVARGAREEAWVELVELGRLTEGRHRARVIAVLEGLPEADLGRLRAAAEADPDVRAGLTLLAPDATPELRARLAA